MLCIIVFIVREKKESNNLDFLLILKMQPFKSLLLIKAFKK
jgi:hypothetical protein